MEPLFTISFDPKLLSNVRKELPWHQKVMNFSLVTSLDLYLPCGPVSGCSISKDHTVNSRVWNKHSPWKIWQKE